MTLAEHLQSPQLPSTPTPDNSHQFSRKNVVGLFITIFICLLIQPYGSLLYRQPRRKFEKVVFFFWRLNPLACVMEGMLLGVAFTVGATRLFRQCPRSSPDRLSWNHLRTAATAVLLLRSLGTTPQQWNTFVHFQQLQSYTPTNWDRNDVQPEVITHVNEAGPAAAPSNGDETQGRVDTPVNRNLDTRQRQFSIPANAESGGITNVQYGISGLGHVQSHIILEILSSIGMVIVIVKLASIVIPLRIRLFASSMVTSWAVLEVIHLISDRRDIHLIINSQLIQCSRDLEITLNRHFSRTFVAVLLFVLSEYFMFAVLQESPAIFPFEMSLRISLICVCGVVSFFFLIPDISLHVPETMKSILNIPVAALKTVRTRPEWARFPILIFIYFASFSTIMLFYFSRVCPHLGMSKNSVTLLVILLAYIPACLRLGFYGPPFSYREHKFLPGQRILLLENLAAAGMAFTVFITRYNAQGTYKPDWLDWLS